MIEGPDGQKLQVVMVAAMSENRVIGRRGELPWRLPADLAHFKASTLGHPVIMGRSTFETLPGPLKGRGNIVMTTQRDWRRGGVVVAHSLNEALAAAATMIGRGDVGSDITRVCIAGGGTVYAEALGVADELDLTVVHATVHDGDAFFPDFDRNEWRLGDSKRHETDARHAHAFTFERWSRP